MGNEKSDLNEAEAWVEEIKRAFENKKGADKMQRHLKLEYVVLGDQAFVRVVEQTHRGMEFTRGGRKIEHSNGYTLWSQIMPELVHSKDLYLRGGDEDKDNDVIAIPVSALDGIKEAVRAYNEMGAREAAGVEAETSACGPFIIE